MTCLCVPVSAIRFADVVDILILQILLHFQLRSIMIFMITVKIFLMLQYGNYICLFIILPCITIICMHV